MILQSFLNNIIRFQNLFYFVLLLLVFYLFHHLRGLVILHLDLVGVLYHLDSIPVLLGLTVVLFVVVFLEEVVEVISRGLVFLALDIGLHLGVQVLVHLQFHLVIDLEPSRLDFLAFHAPFVHLGSEHYTPSLSAVVHLFVGTEEQHRCPDALIYHAGLDAAGSEEEQQGEEGGHGWELVGRGRGGREEGVGQGQEGELAVGPEEEGAQTGQGGS